MAAFCLITGQPVDVYKSLTIGQREAFLELASKRR